MLLLLLEALLPMPSRPPLPVLATELLLLVVVATGGFLTTTASVGDGVVVVVAHGGFAADAITTVTIALATRFLLLLSPRSEGHSER